MNRKTLCVDFDGVLHAYTSPFTADHVIADGPMPGAMDWLYEVTETYDIAVYSARCATARGRDAVERAIASWVYDAFGQPVTADIMRRVMVVEHKPPCWALIDDRCIPFRGTFPSLDQIATMEAFR